MKAKRKPQSTPKLPEPEPKTLSELSSEELREKASKLKSELAEIEAEGAVRQEVQRKKRVQELKEKAPALLTFVKHGRTSCDDENAQNAYAKSGQARCTRCALLELERGNLFEDDIEDFHFEVIIYMKGS